MTPGIALSISPVDKNWIVLILIFHNVLLFIIGSDIGIIFTVLPAPSSCTAQKTFSTCASITSWFQYLRRFLEIDTKQCAKIETGLKRIVVQYFFMLVWRKVMESLTLSVFMFYLGICYDSLIPCISQMTR